MEPPEKGKTKGPQGNTDAYKRMNFLLQAAQLCSLESPQLSRFYVNSMRAISEKQLIRLCAKPSRVITISPFLFVLDAYRGNIKHIYPF
jgi:hypothetical protein